MVNMAKHISISFDLSEMFDKVGEETAIKGSKLSDINPISFERTELTENYKDLILDDMRRSLGVLTFSLRKYGARRKDVQGGKENNYSIEADVPEGFDESMAEELRNVMNTYIKYQALFKWYGEILGLQDATSFLERSNESLMQVMMMVSRRLAPSRTAPAEKTRESCNFE